MCTLCSFSSNLCLQNRHFRPNVCDLEYENDSVIIIGETHVREVGDRPSAPLCSSLRFYFGPLTTTCMRLAGTVAPACVAGGARGREGVGGGTARIVPYADTVFTVLRFV